MLVVVAAGLHDQILLVINAGNKFVNTSHERLLIQRAINILLLVAHWNWLLHFFLAVMVLDDQVLLRNQALLHRFSYDVLFYLLSPLRREVNLPLLFQHVRIIAINERWGIGISIVICFIFDDLRIDDKRVTIACIILSNQVTRLIRSFIILMMFCCLHFI